MVFLVQVQGVSFSLIEGFLLYTVLSMGSFLDERTKEQTKNPLFYIMIFFLWFCFIAYAPYDGFFIGGSLWFTYGVPDRLRSV